MAEHVTKNIVKIVVSSGQARVTIPKELAVKCKILTEDGEPGEATYVEVTREGSVRLVLHPLKLEELTENA